MWSWSRIRLCWCTAERSSHGYCNDWRSFDRPCPSRTVTLDAAACAKKLGAVITYDPNYRANLWKSKEDAIAQMKAPLPLVDILKVSDEELPLLTGTTDCESGTAQLAQNGIRLIFVTLGANGV